MIRALVVDDERLARVGLKRQLAKLDGVKVVGEAGDGASAVAAIDSLKPDLVFLDVMMPAGGGFDVVERVGPSRMPAVVFVTAYDEHAIRAFEADAVDYLLKPIDPTRLEEAVSRAARRLSGTPSELADQLARMLRRFDRASGGSPTADRIPVEEAGRYRFLAGAEVTRAEAQGNYVLLHAHGRAHRVRSTLDAIGARLGDRFLRVGRSTLINRDLVDGIEYFVGGRYLITLRDGAKVESSRHYRAQVASLLR